jgi:hypothetical protein
MGKCVVLLHGGHCFCTSRLMGLLQGQQYAKFLPTVQPEQSES